MPYDILFEPDAVEHLQGFSARAQSTVLDQIEVQLTYQPDMETRNRKRLRPNSLAPWELRIGEIGVFYDVNADAGSVRVIAVGRKDGSRLIIGGEEISL
jgi:mRNA-degrading endonuclease RelE of RelBE toxin-antitoxin system